MSMYSSLLDLAEELATDSATKAAYTRDPEAFLADRGLDELEADNLDTALEHVADALPVELSTQLGPDPGAAAGDALGRLVDVDPASATDLDFGAGEVDSPEADDPDDDEDELDDVEVDLVDRVDPTDGADDGTDPGAGGWAGEAVAELHDEADPQDPDGGDAAFGDGADDGAPPDDGGLDDLADL